MGRVCIKDHRPENSLGDETWLNSCAQCEVERLRAELVAAQDDAALWEERARHLGWKDEHAHNAQVTGQP